MSFKLSDIQRFRWISIYYTLDIIAKEASGTRDISNVPLFNVRPVPKQGKFIISFNVAEISCVYSFIDN